LGTHTKTYHGTCTGVKEILLKDAQPSLLESAAQVQRYVEEEKYRSVFERHSHADFRFHVL
jgi:hypothetical protein